MIIILIIVIGLMHLIAMVDHKECSWVNYWLLYIVVWLTLTDRINM